MRVDVHVLAVVCHLYCTKHFMLFAAVGQAGHQKFGQAGFWPMMYAVHCSHSTVDL